MTVSASGNLARMSSSAAMAAGANSARTAAHVNVDVFMSVRRR